MQSDLEQATERLAAWCRARDYAGYDPFDALNSRLFQATPLASSQLARLAWTQAFKRSPINLRTLARVPAERNPKGIALFALAALARFRTIGCEEEQTRHRGEARRLLDDLCALKIEGWSGAAWGYNFDWQSRAFFARRGTPTIVPTAFAARALIEAWVAFGDERYLRYAHEACDFILHDLRRTHETEQEVCFSYTPGDSSCVYNASLLAAETLATVGAATNESDLLQCALRAARFVARRQQTSGAWAYGAAANQTWTDNFHTAYILLSLRRIIAACKSHEATRTMNLDELDASLRHGFTFWQANFFLPDGQPKYFHNRVFPVDPHATASAVVALLELTDIEPRAIELAQHYARWALAHLRSEQGYFYYQRRRFFTIRTPYMRWTQGWMLYALTRLLEVGGRRSTERQVNSE